MHSVYAFSSCGHLLFKDFSLQTACNKVLTNAIALCTAVWFSGTCGSPQGCCRAGLISQSSQTIHSDCTAPAELHTYRSMTQAVTASPCCKQDSGFLSFALQSRNALFCFPQDTAICLLMARSTEDVGGGASAADISCYTTVRTCAKAPQALGRGA